MKTLTSITGSAVIAAALVFTGVAAGGDALTAEPVRLPGSLPTQPADAPAYSAPVGSLAAAVKTGRAPRAIYDVLRVQNAAPVLVRLNIPGGWYPEHLLRQDQVEAQRRAIVDMQQRVLDKLGGAGVESIKRYQYVPYVAAHATEAALSLLVRMPEVYVIRTDHVEAPELATSAPIVGADDVMNALGGAAGAGQTVAILDTGVDKNHPFLGGRVVSEGCYSTDSFWSNTDSLCPNGSEATTVAGSGVPCSLSGCGHGTHVAGIAAGSDSASAGVAPAASIIAMQVFHRRNSASACAQNGQSAPCVRTFPSDYMLALERVFELRNTFAIAAVNLSLGGGSYTSQASCDDDNEPINETFALVRGAGIAPVVSSGNGAQVMLPGGATQFVPGIARPACVSNAVSVGNVRFFRSFGTVNTGSQTAPFLSLLAPGTSISSSVPGGGFDTMTGTSMAAPHVTGAFAVLKSVSPFHSVDTLLNRLRNTGVLTTDTRPTIPVITPRIQVDAAVEDATGVPLRPGNVQVTAATGTTLQTQWRDNSVSEAEFEISAKPVNDALLPTRRSIVARNLTDGVVSGLVPNKTYDVTVRACNAAGQCSVQSVADTVTTLDTRPSVPTNLRGGTVTTSSIQVLWDSNSANPVTSFRLRSTANPSRTWTTQTLPASARSHTFSNLGPNAGYSFVIQACNDFCSGDSQMLTLVTQSAGSPPAAPSQLRFCGSQQFELCVPNRLGLAWRDNASNEDRYELQRTQAQAGVPPWQGGAATTILAPNSRGHDVPFPVAGTLHYFRVRACNVAGCSAYSNVISYTAP